MLLFQYLAGRGACLSQRFLPRTGAAPHRLAQRRILNQKINIRIHTDHQWPERVVFDTTP